MHWGIDNKLISFLYKWDGEGDGEYTEVTLHNPQQGKIPRGNLVKVCECSKQLVISYWKTHIGKVMGRVLFSFPKCLVISTCKQGELFA